jgi:bla regulator protein blaR1
MWTPILPLSSGLLRHVAEPAARSLALACLAAGALVSLRARSVSLKTAVWRGILVAALAMPLAGLVAPQIRVFVPLPQFETHMALETPIARSIPAAAKQTAIVSPDRRAPVDTVNAAAWQEASVAPVRRSRPVAWPLVLASAYLFVALLLLARVFVGAELANGLVRAASPIGDAAALRELARCARRARLGTQPLLAESESVVVPATLRVRRPAILLPPSWREWDQEKLAAVIAHEVSHIRRRDALVQSLALIHRAVFWFSPLGWWLERHLAELAEQASDEAALAGGMGPSRYAETLLGFFADVESSRSRLWWQGVAMAKCGRAEKRIDRILAWRSVMPSELKKSLVVAVAVLAAPLVALTASVDPFFSFPQWEVPPAPQAPPVPVRPMPSPNPLVNPGPAPDAPAVAPVAPSSPPPAIAVATQSAPEVASFGNDRDMDRLREDILKAQKSVLLAERQVASVRAELSSPQTEEQFRSLRSATEAYRKAMQNYEQAVHEYRAAAEKQASGAVSGGVEGGVSGGARGGEYGGVYSDSGQRFVIVTKNSDSVIMSGSSEDEEHAKALRSKIPGDFIWFERDEKSYIIRDQATVDRAKSFWAPERELGRQQEALGKQQQALGEQQEELSRQMQEVRVKIPDLSAQMEKLAAEMKQLSANGGTVEQIGDLQSEIGDLQSRIGEIESQAGRQQGEIGRQQGELGRKQGELGRQQGELGRRQGEMARQASQQMKQLLDDAIAKGLAQPE